MPCTRRILVWALYGILADSLWAQSAGPNTAGQIEKKVWLGPHEAPVLDLREGFVTHPVVLGYLQALADRLARATNYKEPQVQVPYGSAFYARLTSQNVLYISAALLERIDSEAELAGLVAHQLAHERSPRPPELVCVLAAPFGKWGEAQRGAERAATESALPVMKTLGYDPAALLDLLSKLAYEHPAWGKEIVAEDLLRLRVGMENEPMPDAGYRIDSSAYLKQRAIFLESMGHLPSQLAPSMLRRAPPEARP